MVGNARFDVVPSPKSHDEFTPVCGELVFVKFTVPLPQNTCLSEVKLAVKGSSTTAAFLMTESTHPLESFTTSFTLYFPRLLY